mgnify:CR=1 FL=1
MQIVSQTQYFEQKTALTIGNFDGFHKGHVELVIRLVEYARKHSVKSIVLTFDPHPLEFFSPETRIPRINGLAETERILEPMGVDLLVQMPFTKALAGMSPQTFFQEVIQRTFNPEFIVVGEDHHFGKNREGTPAVLNQLCDENCITVDILPQVVLEGKVISSTVIRRFLEMGDIQSARRFLGHGLFYSGVVEAGAGRGKGLGFPTINLHLPGRALPPPGVYASMTNHRDKWIPSVSYFGNAPTFNGTKLILETHLLEQTPSLYGDMVTVDILDFIREDQRFSTPDMLKEQITRDIDVAHKMIRNFSGKGDK